jgi:hypothetical protein
MDPKALRRRQEGTAELDAAFTALIGDDVELLRIPVLNFIGYLRMLTLSSVHPMLDGQDSTAAELVDVVLEGALSRPGATGRRPTTKERRPAAAVGRSATTATERRSVAITSRTSRGK